MKAIRYIAAFVLLLCISACEPQLDRTGISGESVAVTLTVALPEPVPMPTKGVMGEGPVASDFKVYLCIFGEGDGYVQNWISTTLIDPVISGEYLTGGKFTAYLPIADDARTIHVIANPPQAATPTTSGYLDNVMENMVDTDGQCSYWQQISLPNGIHDDEATATAFTGLQLVRNFAKVVVTTPDPDSEQYEGFQVKQWTLINVPTHGYVAPYTGDPSSRFPATYLNVADHLDALYDDLVEEGYAPKMPSDATINHDYPGNPAAFGVAAPYVRRGAAKYMYERPCPPTSYPTAVLAQVEFDADFGVPGMAGETFWYKIQLLNNEGQYVPVYRDVVYTLTLQKLEAPGEETAEKAFNGPSFGNISASLETASLQTLSNGTSTIHVDNLDYTFITEAGSSVLLKSEDGTQPAKFWFIPGGVYPDMYTESAAGICTIDVTVKTVPDYRPAVNGIVVNGSDGPGTIVASLAESSNYIKKSVIRVAGQAEGGQLLYRDITVTVMNQQSLGATISGSASGLNNDVTIGLHLPEGLGSSVFPIRVRIEAEQNTLSATTSDLQVMSGLSVFPSKTGKNTFYFIRTIKYSDYCYLNPRTKKYVYNYDFTCSFKTNKSGDNSTAIDVRDLDGRFIQQTLAL